MDHSFGNKEVRSRFIVDDIPRLIHTPYVTTNDKRSQLSGKRYENNTYIDWVLESVRMPHGSSFITKKWTAIVFLSILVGYFSSFIDLASASLNDVKKGICFSGIDKWSLLNPYLTCPEGSWSSYSTIFFGGNGLASTVFVDFPIYFIIALIWIIIAAYITIGKVNLVKQSGIPEIRLIASGLNYNIPEYLGLRTLLYKIIGLTLVVSSGLWLGKEGPLVHVSCCIQNIIYEVILQKSHGNEALRRELLSAATATGISVAFNAPIGGVLFVLESMPSFYIPTKTIWNSFVSATIATVVVTGFQIFAKGKDFSEGDLFRVQFGNFSWLLVDMIPFLIMGICGGLYGFIFTKINSKVSLKPQRARFQRWLCRLFNLPVKYGSYIEISSVLAVTTVLNFPLNISRLPLAAYLKVLFKDCNKNDVENFICQDNNLIKILKLGYLFVQGFFLASYSFGLDLPGGVLMPTLVLGAIFGRLVGVISEALQTKFKWDYLATCTTSTCLVSPSSYAVVSAAAFLTGITKLTMSVVVIIFELTGAVSYVLPIMISVMVLKLLNDCLCSDNIYDTWLKMNFNVFSSGKGEINDGKGNGLVEFSGLVSSLKQKLPDVSIKHVMAPLNSVKSLQLLPEVPYTTRHLIQFMNQDNHEGYPLLLSELNPIILGYVTKANLTNVISEVDELDSIISFQLSHLSNYVISQQIQYEQQAGISLILQIDIETEDSDFVINQATPVVEVLELFEKLSLNYLMIRSDGIYQNQKMVGFVDRFILSRLIDSGFASLNVSQDEESTDHQFEIESDDLFDYERDDRDRQSFELIT